MKPTRISSAIVLGVVAVAACTIAADDVDVRLGVNSLPITAEDETPFTPAEVANLLEVIHLGALAQARLAIQQAQSAEVKAFALNAVVVHDRRREHAHALLGLEPSSETKHAHLMRDPTASLLLHEGEVLTNDLKNQTGARFDLAYLTGRITGDAGVLALIDHALLYGALAQRTAPSQQASSTTTEVKENELRAELEATRTETMNQLVRALQLQQALRSSNGATPPSSLSSRAPSARNGG